MQQDKITERYRYPISDVELDRRLRVTQAAVRAAGLDCIITQNHSAIFDGGIRYFLDQPTGGYSTALMVPAEGQMVVIDHGPEQAEPILGPMRNVEKMYVKPYCPVFTFSDTMAGAVMANEICRRGYKKIGLYGTQFISYSFGDYLKENLPDCTWVNFNNEMDAITAVKSPEERELCELSVRYHERLMEAVPALLVPGKLECEVRAELESLARRIGCEAIGNIGVGSGPKDTPVMFMPHFRGNRRIRKDDTVTVMIEVSGPGGMYSELARTFTLGRPSDSLLRLFDMARRTQERVAAAMRPGVTGRELTEIYDEFVDSFHVGIGHNTRNAGHSQGYDMMETPAIALPEDNVFRENMFVAIHPELTALDNFAICCDNFFVTAKGAERITRTEQKVFQVDV